MNRTFCDVCDSVIMDNAAVLRRIFKHSVLAEVKLSIDVWNKKGTVSGFTKPDVCLNCVIKLIIEELKPCKKPKEGISEEEVNSIDQPRVLTTASEV